MPFWYGRTILTLAAAKANSTTATTASTTTDIAMGDPFGYRVGSVGGSDHGSGALDTDDFDGGTGG